MSHTFGYYAAAVACLYSKEIAAKHKYINSTNVLMSESSLMLTDFWLSNSFKGMENGISSGKTGKTSSVSQSVNASLSWVALCPRCNV